MSILLPLFITAFEVEVRGKTKLNILALVSPNSGKPKVRYVNDLDLTQITIKCVTPSLPMSGLLSGVKPHNIDRSHRLGFRSETTTATGSPPKPRPVIVKLTSYESRKAIFNNKRKLKGTRYVVTENLTKRRAELLRKARMIDGITSTWTIDGRIVCLLANGRKVTVQTDSDLASVRHNCRR